MALNNDNIAYRGINYWVAMVAGWVLVLVGLWGFFQDPILGIFETGFLHNLVHLLSGAVLLAAAYINNGEHARTANLTLGLVYLVVVILGFATPALLQGIIDFGYGDGGANQTTNVFAIPDNWLHLALAATFLTAALAERNPEVRPSHGATR